MRIGFIYVSDEIHEIWGSAITTYYLAEAFKNLGHEVVRASITTTKNWDIISQKKFDFIISEGVPFYQLPDQIKEQSNKIIFWWLSTFHYNIDSICQDKFDAIATNSEYCYELLQQKKIFSKLINLAVPSSFSEVKEKEEYKSVCTFLGTNVQKTEEQIDFLFKPASEIGLTIWGNGWDKTKYLNYFKGPLPLLDIGTLYKSVQVVLLLTENKQKNLKMINNRAFEAVGSGSITISDHFDYLKNSPIGKFIKFFNTSSEIKDYLIELKNNSKFYDQEKKLANEGKKYVLENEVYELRAKEFIDLYNLTIC